MKKGLIITIILSAVLTAGALTGCSSNNDAKEATKTETSQKSDTTKENKTESKKSDSTKTEAAQKTEAATQEQTTLGSSDSKTETTKSDSKTESSNTNTSKNNNNTSTSNNNKTSEKSTQKQDSKKTECNHSWVAQTKTVHHNAVTHQEPVYEQQYVVDSAAWDEPIYERAPVCIACGQVYPSDDHMVEHILAGNGGNYTVKNVQVGTQHHDEVGHYENVQVGTTTVTDGAAWDETVTSGYKCSKCGATK